MTQYRPDSLNAHLQQAWHSAQARTAGFIELMPGGRHSATGKPGRYYSGTADAVYQNLDSIAQDGIEYVLVLAGDHVYKADYRRFVECHVNRRADVTVAAVPVPIEQADQFGILQLDARGRVERFVEKPSNPQARWPGQQRLLASMGIYVFTLSALREALEADAHDRHSAHDFGHDILPKMLGSHRIVAYAYGQHSVEGYWRDVGTLDSYYQANLSLIDGSSGLELHDPVWPVHVWQPALPPTRLARSARIPSGTVCDSIIATGGVIEGANIRGSVVGTSVRVGAHSDIDNAVLLPGVVVGKGCTVRNAILESQAVVPDGLSIGVDAEQDRRWFSVSPGGVVVVSARALHQLTNQVTTQARSGRERRPARTNSQQITPAAVAAS